jgi:uncharacterized protein (DUF362 family)
MTGDPVETRGGEEEQDWDISPHAQRIAASIQHIVDTYSTPAPAVDIVDAVSCLGQDGDVHQNTAEASK